MFLKIFEISYINNSTVRRQTELLVKTSERWMLLLVFQANRTFSRNNRFFKFAFETEPVCAS